MDFNALRARFQDEEILLRQPPRPRPALPEKPQVVPPPQSPAHHLPAGARPSLLTSISLDARAAPGGFKDDKKDARKPLLALTSKTKEKDRKSAKEEKDPPKAKSGKERKGLLLFRSKESSELVAASPPPAKGTLRKMAFSGFKKSSKRGSMDLEPILDSPSPDHHGGLAPLVPSGSAPSAAAPPPPPPAPPPHHPPPGSPGTARVRLAGSHSHSMHI